MTESAGVPLMVGGVLTAATVIENGGSALLTTPSLTEIVMPDCVPACSLVGVPERRPVAMSKLAQAGRPVIENVSGCLSGSLAEGVKAYDCPALTELGGVPLMVGGVLTPTTVIENGASEVLACPSLTLITMLEYVPAFENAGDPLKAPVALSNRAQPGRPATEKLSAWPSGSEADGLNA